MSVERLKTYRLTCDGEIMWKGFREDCNEKKIVQYPNKDDLMHALKLNMEGSDYAPYSGWHLDAGGEVRCPRFDHIKED